jgi:hypothetical protein
MNIRAMVNSLFSQRPTATRVKSISLRSTKTPVDELLCPHCGGEITIVEKDLFETVDSNEFSLEIHYTCTEKQQPECSKILSEEFLIVFSDADQKDDQEESVTTEEPIKTKEDKLDNYSDLILPLSLLKRLSVGERVDYNSLTLSYHNPWMVKLEDPDTKHTKVVNFSIDKQLGKIKVQDLKLLFEHFKKQTLLELLLSLDEQNLRTLLQKKGWLLEF